MTHADQLRAKLIEDTGSVDEADRLVPIVRQLADWPAPIPTAQQTDRLVQTLTAAMPAPSSRRALMAWLLRAQLRVVQHEIWLASAFVMTLGVLVTLTSQPGLSAEMLPLALIAPLVAALGIAFLYGPAADPSLEIELATPVSPRLIVLVRLLLVFLFDLALGLIGSVALVIAAPRSEWSLWPLVALWLAPMTFLAALAFLLSMLFVDPLIGVSICLTLWGLQVLRVFPPFATLPNWLSGDLQPWLWLTAVLCVGLALWLAGREERQLLKRI